MPEGTVDAEPIYVFEVDEVYLFKHYLERTDIFDELSEYYNGEEYRFEVPKAAYPKISAFLEEHYYDPIVVDDPEEFAVVKEQYTEHAAILKNAVMYWSRDDYDFFIMKDPQTYSQADHNCAVPITETELVLGI